MKDYKNQTPVFSESIKITEATDPAHADNINAAPIQLLQNTLCNHKSIEKLEKSTGATDEYSEDISYQVGDYCLHEDMLYKCIRFTTGEWDPECWCQTNALEEIEGLRGMIGQQAAAMATLEEMLTTGNVVSDLVTGDGDRFVSVNGDSFKALKKIQFK